MKDDENSVIILSMCSAVADSRGGDEDLSAYDGREMVFGQVYNTSDSEAQAVM